MLPILFQSHDLIVYSYPLLMGIGWGVAYQIYFHLLSPAISRAQGQLVFWGIFISAWIGAKLFFYITLPSHLGQNLISELSFWSGGGFVFYGGFLGGVIFLLACHKMGFKMNEDRLWPILPSLTIGHGIGRIGCALAGCCYGAPTNFFWGIQQHGFHRHPTQLIEAVSLIGLGIFFLKSHRSKRELVLIYLVAYGFLRFFIEVLRGDEVRGIWGTFTPSQWISMGLISLGLYGFSTKRVKFSDG